MEPSVNTAYDIVIAGGGMIGTSLALALAPLGLKVAVVEPVPLSAPEQPSFDERTTALSRSSQRMFEALGLWDAIQAAATPIVHIHVSDQGRFGFARIDAQEQGVEALGYVIINRVLGTVMQETLGHVGGLDVYRPARIVSTAANPDHRCVSVEDESGKSFELNCRLLVAADGASSPVRDMLGIAARREDYGQQAIVGNLLTEKPIANRAYERFTEQGPLALLPLSQGRTGFVWTVRDADADRIVGLADAAFLDELQEAFGYRLGSLTRVGQRAAYPLSLSKAARLTGPRAVLVGNAAHGLHPVAAQGFNLGLRDVAALCDCIADAVAEHPVAVAPASDVGSAVLLDEYARWRRNDQRKVAGFTHGLVRLFGDSRGPVRVLRSVGMLAFDVVPGVRRLFARHTMGLAGRLPRLSRGMPLT